MSRLLVITWPFPPVPSVGANRWLAMRSHLAERGHDVSVLTTSMFGTLPDDAHAGVVRAHDLAESPWIRRALRREPLRGADAVTTAPAADASPPALLTQIIVPDAWLLSWVPFAARAARSIVRSRGIDCVITTSPYESVHLIPRLMGRSRPAWVADLRDGWTFEPHRPPFRTAAQRALDRRLERWVAESADRVTAATRPIAEDLRARLGVDAAYVPNGWDPRADHASEGPVARLPYLSADRVTVLHSGTLGGLHGRPRDPRPLITALKGLQAEEGQLGGRLEFVFLGRLSSEIRELLAGAGLEDTIRLVGEVPRDEAVRAQRQADVLLLLTARGARSEATGKLFEYLATDRPILALAERNEAARIVAENRAGTVVAPDDVEAIRAALRSAARGELTRERAAVDSAYTYPAPSIAMEEQIGLAITAAARRGA